MHQAILHLTDAVHVLLESVALPHSRKETIMHLLGDVRLDLARIASPAPVKDPAPTDPAIETAEVIATDTAPA